MSTKKLNEQQQQAVDSDELKILCLAGAGAGKTATMIERITRLTNEGVNPMSILVLTFTNAAGFEMKERYKKANPGKVIPEFRTFHSFCYSLIVKDRNVRRALGYVDVPTIIEEVELKKVQTEAKMMSGVHLSEAKLRGEGTLSQQEQYELELYKKALKRLIREKNIITFDMLCYDVAGLFIQNDPSVLKYKGQYKYLFVDEFQDTDPKQVQFLNSFDSKDVHFYFVGDCLQCQPSGSKVLMSDGSEKNIEDIVAGDSVFGYVPKDGRFKKNNDVIEVASRYSDDIIEIVTDNHRTRYTKDHLTYAKIHYQGNENKRCVYLMSNDKGWWRIGECSLYLYDGKDFGPKHRMHEEGCSKVWILKICDDARESSWYEEQFAAFYFGIPDTTFQFANTYRYTEETMQKLFDNIYDIEERAQKCLEYYGLDIRYPFFDKYKDKHRHMSKMHIFEIHAGNLIPEFMDVAVPLPHEDKYRHYQLGYETVRSINKCEPSQVYSLNVDYTHNYVSDGILTHNCIYKFRGCSNDYIKALAKDDSWQKIKLSQNYRSTTQICDFAKMQRKKS